ncbi:hypothetical protein HXX76_003999 [Chlamydomonas incerta]|uniref:Uncharacterized protein n=1 Tax=Chlamydomonas incerta TaxID=51695 RepID=A0A835W5B8_CHLIN|nr:hypothetical protein HXX76_003999 [Chlamydomonas incerta]|eukprot:KAG2441147.1 hypothetical protein HXX76_003999 [Chlamydomonas incerta]
MARRTSALLLALCVVALVGIAVDAGKPPPRKAPRGPSCADAKLYRYISITRYSSTEKLDQIVKIDGDVAKSCSQHFARGVIGGDLGLGVSLYNSTGNYHTAKVLDFMSKEDIVAYKACEGANPGKAQLATLATQTGKAKVVVPLPNACAMYGVTPSNLVTVFMYNMTGKDDSPAVISEIVKNVDMATGPIVPCLAINPVIKGDLDWAAFLGESSYKTTPGGVFQAVGGDGEFTTIQRMRAYWAYLIGPPRDPYLSKAVAYIAGALRIQFNATDLKA